MIRIALTEILLFSLPFIVYFGFLYLRREQDHVEGFWHDVPLFYLTMAGCGLIALGFVGFATFTGAPTGADYIPAIIEDGKIVPGHMERGD